MVWALRIEQPFAAIDDGVGSLARSPEALAALEHALFRQGIEYSLSDLFEMRVAELSLPARNGPAEMRAVIWRIPVFGFFEVALQCRDGRLRDGGWLMGEPPLVVTDETSGVWPVLLTTYAAASLRHEYRTDTRGYEPVFGARPAPLKAARRIARRRTRPPT